MREHNIVVLFMTVAAAGLASEQQGKKQLEPQKVPFSPVGLSSLSLSLTRHRQISSSSLSQVTVLYTSFPRLGR